MSFKTFEDPDGFRYRAVLHLGACYIYMGLLICEWEDCHVPWLTKSKDRERIGVVESCIREQFSIHTFIPTRRT